MYIKLEKNHIKIMVLQPIIKTSATLIWVATSKLETAGLRGRFNNLFEIQVSLLRYIYIQAMPNILEGYSRDKKTKIHFKGLRNTASQRCNNYAERNDRRVCKKCLHAPRAENTFYAYYTLIYDFVLRGVMFYWKRLHIC